MNQLGAGKIRDFLKKIREKAKVELDRHMEETYDLSPPSSPIFTRPVPVPFDKKVRDTRFMEGGSDYWKTKVDKRKKLFGF